MLMNGAHPMSVRNPRLRHGHPVSRNPFDALQLATRTLWEVKTDNFDTYSDFLKGRVIRDHVVELRSERALTRACGFDFRVGVRSEEHQEALGEEAIGSAPHRVAGRAAEERLGGAIESDHAMGRVHAHDGDGRRADHRTQLRLARTQLGLDLAPGPGRRHQRLGQVVELADGEGAEGGDFALAQRVRAVLDRPHDPPHPARHEQGEADGDQDEGPGDEVPAPAGIPAEQDNCGDGTERQTREE